MHGPWPQGNLSTRHAEHEYPGRHHFNGPQEALYHHNAGQPPRPMEPHCRPPLHTTLTETAGRLRLHQEKHAVQDPQYSEHRAQRQSLPALRDVLPRDSYPFCSVPLGAQSSSNLPGPMTRPSHGGHHILGNLHPPMVLPPPTPTDHRYRRDADRAYDDPGRVDARQSQGFPQPAYLDASQRYTDIPLETRLEPAPAYALSHSLPNALPNGHVDQNPEEVSSHSPAAALARSSQNAPPAQPGAGAHGKIVCIKKVPGEGDYFVYEDGHRIPTQVDGELVNPAWGLTKANKPRKRLATACLDCREKKIKCEPGVKSCVQCEKAMRPCRKAVDKLSQADTPTNTLYVAGSPTRQAPPTSDSGRTSDRSPDLESISKRRSRADPSPPLEPSKKHRDYSPQPSRTPNVKALHKMGEPAGRLEEMHNLHLSLRDPMSWEDDPYEMEPDMTLHLVNLYFDHINQSIYSIFPRRHFIRWMKEHDQKCQNERMALYAILAAASVFADRDFAAFGKNCATIASNALATQTGKFNVAAAQSKLFLAFYHLAKGADGYQWDYIGSAIRTVLNMNLNTEDGCLNDKVSKGQQRYEFAFSPQQLAECKRRTFWCSFLQDRFCGPTVCTVKPEDVFVRLPCPDEMYETSVPSDAPYFANGIMDPVVAGAISAGRVSPFAWLIPAAAALGDVTDFVFRAAHRSGCTYREEYEAFYTQIQMRLQDWTENLPEHMQYCESNVQRSSREGYLEAFVLTHVLYHYAMLKLNRYVRHRLLQDRIIRNIRAANDHGHRLLQIVNSTQQERKVEPAPSDSPGFVFSSPIVGFAITSAIDVISAGGKDSTLGSTLDEIHQALGTLRNLERHWNIATNQKKQCQTRFYQLNNITTHPKTAKSGCWVGRNWGTVAPPLEQDVHLQNDCIYGLGEREGDEASQLYFEAFNEG